ncbi:MAG: lamin tail domain-containing protein, partial [Bacteroidales bacterium]|nr:lamin tail domain-containing protein [Bacteroidales bacterium]
MKKFKLLIITILLIAGNKVTCQIYDDFSDGNFSENPTWEGDTASFIINPQFQLQLNADNESTASLTVDGSFLGEEMEWRMAVKLAFAPSGSNFARIYLEGDSSGTSNSIRKGYFLQLGEAGNNDVMELFYGEGENMVSICRGRTSIASSFYYNIKVTKSADNLWTLYCDSLRNGLYVEECSGYGRDEPPFSGGFSVYCKFTSGNRTKFTFDDFYLGPPLIDSLPPKISNFVFQYPDIVKITFSEAMNDSSALSPSDYLILEDGQTPALCELENENLLSVTLYFAEPLMERQNYHLSIRNATDIAGNAMNDTLLSLFYCLPKRNEVLITEIMADPTPPVQLPECEYVELHNTLEYNIILKNWQLQIGNNRRTLPEISMAPHGYTTIIAESSLPLFTEDGTVATISSLTLTDDGQRLVLLNESDDVIHTVNYNKNWHKNALKRDGG